MFLNTDEFPNTFAAYKVTLQEILPLRQRVLLDQFAIETAYSEDDKLETTWHTAMCHRGDSNLPKCCASFILGHYQEANAWQLRGMATDPKWQHRGLGRALLGWAQPLLVASSGIKIFWCNARVSALGFYQKQGWHSKSEEFIIPDIGKHRLMVKSL